MSSAVTKLPRAFRKIRLELAREKDHPAGDPRRGYFISVPLDAEHRIDADLWKEYRDNFRGVRFRPDQDDDIGHLIHRPGGTWTLRYDIRGTDEEEAPFHFEYERFEVGEYVSIREADGMHTYQVITVEPV